MLCKLKTRDWFHCDGFPITVERREPQKPFGAHSHEFAELVIVTGGTGLHVVGRHSWKLVTGDIFVIGGPYVHEYQGLANLKLINILFQPLRINFPTSDLAAVPGYHVLFNLEPA
jgi:quercetin dioxygenase-like cupin family protein